MTKKTGRRFLTRSLKVLTRAWVVVEVVRIHTVWFPGPARLRVERIASSGLAASRDRSSRQSRRWPGTFFTWAGTSRQTIR